ncbi:hypothetical protein HID58_066815, partial [Brassica napus]
ISHRVYDPRLLLPPSETLHFPSSLFPKDLWRLKLRSSYLPEMRGKSDPALGSSSIGDRVRSKNRVGVEPCESMDSSNHSLDLTSEIEGLRRAVVESAPPASEAGRLHPMGPLSVIGVEEVAGWREKFELSDDVDIRVPGPIERVSDFDVDKVPVYEGFFKSGFRDRVHSLVAKVSEALGISPGQLNLPSWRALIAMQNLGDLEGLVIEVAEVLYSYSISPLNGGEGRYHLHPCNRELPRKRHPAFDGRWTEKFAFMRLPGFSAVWRLAGGRTTKRVLKHPSERRQIPFLCHVSGDMSGSKGEEALAEYKRAFEVVSAKKAAPKRAAPSKNDDEVQFIKSNKRQAVTAPASSSKKRSKASGSTLKVSPSSSSDPATVLANLNTKVFPLTPVSMPEDSLAAIQSVQSDLLQLFHLGERIDDHTSIKADMAALISQLREEKDNVLAKEKEIKALKLRVRNQHEVGMLAASENVSLREQLERREEEICDLRCAAETFDVENAMAVNGAMMVTRWELMREWLNHQTDSWELEVALEQYKMVKTSEARLQGLPTPSFEGKPSIPSKTEAEKTPEPTADDPLDD